MASITPTVLAKTKEEFEKKICNAELRKLESLWQIDILDGSLVNAFSWADPMDIKGIDLPNLELHLMTNDPVCQAEDWDDMTEKVRRAIVHAELINPIAAIEEIRGMEIACGIAINPETDISVISEMEDLIETILILGVNPGVSGQVFLGDTILKKIRVAKNLYPDIEICVDGGINLQNAKSILDAGADRLCCSSAIWKSNDPSEAYRLLRSM
ncbi:hypothetical protein KJ766_02820 [Patescibacteria group bacterium]|nr:hypothetical protein [Patescibacteria group bacterium]